METIRALRCRAGLSQEALALRVGVSRQTVNSWEKGVWPSAELVPKIAFALGCEIKELYAQAVDPGVEENVSEKDPEQE